MNQVGPLSPKKTVLPQNRGNSKVPRIWSLCVCVRTHAHTCTHREIFVLLFLLFMSVTAHYLLSKFVMCVNLPDNGMTEADRVMANFLLDDKRAARHLLLWVFCDPG